MTKSFGKKTKVKSKGDDVIRRQQSDIRKARDRIHALHRRKKFKSVARRKHGTSIIQSNKNEKASIVSLSTSIIRKVLAGREGNPAFANRGKLRQLVRISNKTQRALLHNEAALAIASKEEQALPPVGGRPWKCTVKISEDDDCHDERSTTKKKKSGPLFRWFRGRLELACLPHFLEKIKVVEDYAILQAKRDRELGLRDGTSDESSDDDDDDQEEDLVPKTSLQERKPSALSLQAWNDSSYPIPHIDRTWLSPDLLTFHTRNAAVDHAKELLRREKIIDRVLHGFGTRGDMLKPAKPTRKMALEAGFYRFLRDGLWVIGQEEDWIGKRIRKWNRRNDQPNCHSSKMESSSSDDTSSNTTSTTAASSSTSCTTTNTSSTTCSQSEMSSSSNKEQHEQHPCAETHTRSTALRLFLSLRQSGFDEMDPARIPTAKRALCRSVLKNKGQLMLNESDKELLLEWDGMNEIQKMEWENLIPEDSEIRRKGNDCSRQTATLEKRSSTHVESGLPLVIRVTSPKRTKSHHSVSTEPDQTTSHHDQQRQNSTSIHIPPSSHWRLTPKQVRLCYDAAMDHYERVIYTVKARALYSELSDGFDVLRERGRGRYDMELAAFESETFHFLTDVNKAAWIPVVRKILGEDLELIHKGVFLSLPGSDTQVYHQDGPHLTTKCQRPCHAVNVFIPLIDLTLQNGPTEFCLGTHFLDYEHYDKDMVEIPVVPAGTPIMFDYRLGHRGLGNSSPDCRPILYLTYASASNEFRDLVNFSRKRYRKIGSLVEKPMSRDERVKKRLQRMGM